MKELTRYKVLNTANREPGDKPLWQSNSFQDNPETQFDDVLTINLASCDSR